MKRDFCPHPSLVCLPGCQSQRAIISCAYSLIGLTGPKYRDGGSQFVRPSMSVSNLPMARSVSPDIFVPFLSRWGFVNRAQVGTGFNEV
ncbi:hypothetical protein CDAR_230761 [Caerostris darwini]|uniref:Uncharacterized protein n=1 Tax=Caerostris darwini TaxID=1538125 RepID=A0AAV4S7D4_9ARAC|nr:hypothetical protein CDAR_230761 [Caerostris darwini]